MSLHIGNSSSLKIYIGNKSYALKIVSAITNITKPILAASDNTIIKDAGGKYLNAKGGN